MPHKIFIVQLAIMLLLVSVCSGRTVEDFNGDWRFSKGEFAEAYSVGFDDSGWEKVRLPHDWAISGPFDAKENGYAAKLPWKGERIING